MRSPGKTIEDFFSNNLGSIIWKNGKKAFSEYWGHIITVPDGTYEAELFDARFEILRRSRPVYIFSFKLPDGSVVEKATSIDSANGVTSLMYELARMNIPISMPSDLADAYDKIRKKKQVCVLSIKTTGIIRNIDIVEMLPEKKMEASTPEIRTVRVEVDGLPEKNPIVTEEVVREAIGDAPKEVDIVPGSKIKFTLDGEEMAGTVSEVYEDTLEMLVVLDNGGSREVISGEDVTELLS